MPVRHDFTCATCGLSGTFWAYVSDPPVHCDQPMTWTPRPGSFAIDAREPFQQFETDVAGEKRRVGSLHDMRLIENETEKRARNGEGQPMVWRDYSQDKSNFDVHTLAPRMDRPVTGYAEGTTGVDGSKFKKTVGAGPKESIV